MSAVVVRRRIATPQRVEGQRRRARARSRALIRLAREYAARYRELYGEELEAPS